MERKKITRFTVELLETALLTKQGCDFYIKSNGSWGSLKQRLLLMLADIRAGTFQPSDLTPGNSNYARSLHEANQKYGPYTMK